SEFAPFYKGYVSLVGAGDIISLLRDQSNATRKLILDIPEEQGEYRYEEGKWTIKELIGHIIDTERIMAYRALRIARNDATPLSGFDQEPYIENANFNEFQISDLAEELKLVRDSNIAMFRKFSAEAWDRVGTASGSPVSTRGLAYIIAGHELHHIKILKDRYLN
ncbi:MAG: DinB family protein, partial [Acidobacteria bacterium]|nr:DinB family protein [Acidobacteriota bacterium]